jgi:hypothetical protein
LEKIQIIRVKRNEKRDQIATPIDPARSAAPKGPPIIASKCSQPENLRA